MLNMPRLRSFVADVGRLSDRAPATAQMLAEAATLMRGLVEHDDWLPEEFAKPHDVHYQQYLLFGDPANRFSVVSFVWGPGQETPIHDHTVWGVIGMLRGSEISQRYRLDATGLRPTGDALRLLPGDIELLSPAEGDIHRVANAHADQVSVSIHLYGGNIGRTSRSAFDIDSGKRKQFISGYSSPVVPNLWAS